MIYQHPDHQLQQWGINRLQKADRASRGVDALIRAARHPGVVYIRPLTPTRSAVIFVPSSQLVPPTIALTGRVKIIYMRRLLDSPLMPVVQLPVDTDTGNVIHVVGQQVEYRARVDRPNRTVIVVADASIYPVFDLDRIEQTNTTGVEHHG